MASRTRWSALLAVCVLVLAVAPAAVAERPVYVTGIAIYNGWGQALAPDGGVLVTGGGSDQFQATPGAWQEAPHDPAYPWNDAFLQKVDATGRTVWATWIGAGGSDQGQNVTVGKDGSVYVAGYSSWSGAADFPTSPGALSSDYVHGTSEVAWLMKFSRAGQLVWSTLVPGARYVHDLAADDQGRLHVTGEAYGDLPVTSGAFDKVAASAEGFVATIAADGSAFEAASYLGGSGWDTGLDIALAPDGSEYVAADTESGDAPTTEGAFDRTHAAGSDALVAHVAADGETLLWSSYLGGAIGHTRPNDANEYVQGLTVGHDGAPVVSGTGASADFPTTPDAAYPDPPDATPPSWVTRFAADGSALEWSTFLPATVREGHLDRRGHTRLVGLAPTPGFAGDSAAWTVLIDLDPRGEVDRVAPIADQMAYDYDVDRAGSSYILSAPRPASSYARAAATKAPDATLSRIPACTIRGTAGPDELHGTPGPDVICAGGGDDVVDSGDGYDVILLGAGDDQAWSGNGVDVVHGGDGADRIAGGASRDLLLGQAGADILQGGSGPDSLFGGGAADRLLGGAGRDEISGGAGKDSVVQ